MELHLTPAAWRGVRDEPWCFLDPLSAPATEDSEATPVHSSSSSGGSGPTKATYVLHLPLEIMF